MSSKTLKQMNLKLGRHVHEGGLDPIPRAISREQSAPPAAMQGRDVWNAYEVSYLQPNGIPKVFHLQASYAADTPHIIESKSFKLYLNSFNNLVFDNQKAFEQQVREETSACVGGPVTLRLFAANQSPASEALPGACIDMAHPTQIPDGYDPSVLRTQEGEGVFTLHSYLLRTLCPVTHQPDWGNVLIKGRAACQPEPQALLAYLVSFRNHSDFHETCCETIFTDLCQLLEPKHLDVSCFYTRRGGLDINPFRSLTRPEPPEIQCTWRQ